MWARWRSCAPRCGERRGPRPISESDGAGAAALRPEQKDATNKEQKLVYATDEVDGACGRSTAYVHDRGARRDRLGADGTYFSLQQHVAAHHQYGHHNRDLSHGVLD